MDEVVPSTYTPVETTPPVYPWWHWRRVGFNFLTLSILAHLLLGTGAAYLIVQTINNQKKSVVGQAAGPAAATHALEHQVAMQKKQATMSAPAAVKRIVTNSASAKVALPAMPAVFNADAQVVPLALAGMGGTGVGLGTGGGGGGGGNGKGGMSLFGLRDGGGLEGHFYDMKQTSGGQPSGMTVKGYNDELARFVRGGWNEASMAKYFRAPTALFATQIFIPTIEAKEGPKAFNVADKVQPNFTAVYYRGKVIAATEGRYRFVGYGDNTLVVRFDGHIVLDCGSSSPSGFKPSQFMAMQGATVPGTPGAGHWYRGSGVGTWVDVRAGQAYEMEILIGEEDGGSSAYFVQVQKENDNYEKDKGGNPILPVFKLSSAEIALPPRGAGHVGEAPVFAKTGPVWRVAANTPGR